MKRFIALVLILLPILSFAQSSCLEANEQLCTIVSDNFSDGVRKVRTGTGLFIDDSGEKLVIYELNGIEINGMKSYILCLTFSSESKEWIIKKGNKALIRNTSEQVIEITQLMDSNYTPIDSGQYMIFSNYIIEEDQINIFSDGIVKIRIQYSESEDSPQSYFDMTFEKPILKKIPDAFKLVKSQLNSQVDLYNGF